MKIFTTGELSSQINYSIHENYNISPDIKSEYLLHNRFIIALLKMEKYISNEACYFLVGFTGKIRENYVERYQA